MTRRNLELTLLCIAAPIVILMFAMMVANQGQPLDFNTLGVPIGIFLAFVVAHLAVRKLAPPTPPSSRSSSLFRASASPLSRVCAPSLQWGSSCGCS